MSNDVAGPDGSVLSEGLGPLPDRWYCVNSIGVATLCSNMADALANAKNCDAMYPAYAPHRAVRLGDVAAERGRCAKQLDALGCDHCAAALRFVRP